MIFPNCFFVDLEEITESPYDLPRELQAMKLEMENFKPHD